MQTFTTLQLSQTSLNGISSTNTAAANKTIRATKRKYENDDSAEKLGRIKRFHKSALSDQSVYLAAQQLVPPTSHCTSTIGVTPTATSLQNPMVANSFTSVPLSTAGFVEAVAEDCMMLEDDSATTDDDDNLKTPSHMDCGNDNSGYLQFDTGDDLEDGGFTGQLERGWHDLYSDPYQQMWAQ